MRKFYALGAAFLFFLLMLTEVSWGQSVVINKYRNTNTTASVIELLVIQNNLDMRNFVLKDFSSNNANDGGGSITFNNVTLWSSVRAGTLIVIDAASTSATDIATSCSDFNLVIGGANTTYFTKTGNFQLSSNDMCMIKTGTTSGVSNNIHTLRAGSTGTQWTSISSGTRIGTTTTTSGTGTTSDIAYVDNASSVLGDYNLGTSGVTIGGSGGTSPISFGSGNNSTNTAFINFLRGPVSNAAETITDNSFIAKWNALTGAASYIIDVDDNSDFSSPLSSYNALNVGNVNSYQISGLASNTTYYYRVRAVNSTPTTSGNSCSQTVTTLSITVPTVTTGSAGSLSTSGATLNGTVSSNGASTTVTFNYGTTVSYGTNATATQSPLAASATNSAVSAELTGLSVNTQYNYRVSATNTAGTTNGSNQSFWTLANVPSAPTLSNATSNSLDISINENGNPASTAFAIQEAGGDFVQADGSLAATAVWNTKSGWGTTTITGLSANTSYTFKVKARNGANTETAYGATANATTLAGTTPSASITGPVTEQQLHGYALAVTLSNETFNTNTPSATDFTLVNAPANLSIGSVTYTNNTSVTLNLNYSGDFDANITNFNVSVSKDILTSGNGGTNLSSNNITLTALTESLSVGTITAFADQAVNTVSSEKTFTVFGTVRGDVTLVPPAGFEISTQTGVSFVATNPITLSPTGTSLSSTAIYVRFKPTAITGYSGNITAASAGVSDATVAVSGTGIAPANPAFTATAVSASAIQFTASANSNSNEIVVVFNTSGSFTAPTNGVAAGSVGNSFANGEILYNGSAAGFTGTSHTGLTQATTYYYKAFSVDASNFYSVGLEASATTAKPQPVSQPTDIVFSSVSSNSFNVAFTAASGTPDGYLVVRSTGSSLSATPVDGTTYTVGASLGGGTVVSAGSTITGIANSSLSAGTTYYIFVFAYNNSGAITDYLTVSPLSSSVLTKVVAPSPSASNATAVSFDLSWTAVTGADSYKLDVSTVNTFASFVPGYSDLTVNGTSVTVTDLSANTQYFFRMRAVNASGASDNSATGSITTSVLSIPTVSAADQITHNSFRANWSSVTGAESYRLDVATSFASVDDFTDGDFTSNPTWSGSTGSYAIQAVTTLNSASNTADGSYLGSTNSAGKTGLYVPSSEVSEWKFSLASTSFNPSTLNYFGVVLMSDATFSDVATSSFNGYYLKIGIDGSTDYVELWRSSGTTKTKIGDFSAIGNFGTGALQNGLNLRITRSNLGVFQVYYSSGFLFTSTPTSDGGSLTDNTHKTSSYFGVYTWFSSPGTSRIVYIDNIVLGNDVYVTDFQDKPVPSNEETVTGLTENTNYYYRVRAYSANSTTSYSATQSVTTYRDIATADFRTKASGNFSSTGTWEYNHTGSSYQDATQVPGTGNNITVQNGHTLTIDNNFTVGTGKTLTMNATSNMVINHDARLSFTGNGSLNGQSVLLKSSANGTASIGQITGTLTGATNVTVERFIGATGAAKRAWRFLSVPLAKSDTTTVLGSWMESGTATSGYGTHITKATSSTATGLFDGTSGLSSIRVLNAAASAWTDIAGTDQPITGQSGYMLFVRGDRTIDLSQGGSATPNNTVLRTRGKLKTGDTTITLSAASPYVVVGNPYASPINFSLITRSNVDDLFYVWDPKRGSSGSWVTFTGPGYTPAEGTGGSYTSATSIIQSGQAFVVKPNGASPSVTIQEADKATTFQNVFKTGNADETLNIQLYSNINGVPTLMDGASAAFNTTYSKAVTSEDITKFAGFSENVAFRRSNVDLVLERRPNVVSEDDTLFVKLWNTGIKAYQLKLNLDVNTSLTPVLEDTYTNTVTPLNTAGVTTYDFSVTSDPQSANQNRFRVVFKTSSTLSTSGLTVKASLLEKQVRIDWSMVNENNVKGYTVERSSDGKTFTALTAVNAKANDNSTVSYDAMDASPLNGMNYYRIKATDVNGKITYSAIVRIKTNDTKASVTVYPNPVKGEQLNIQLNGLSKGTYTIRLYNNLGQEVYGSTLQVTQAAMSQTLNIAALKTSGVYTLRITNGDQTIEQTIVAQ